MAPELLRICSLILADNRIPPGEVTTVTAQGRGKWGRRAAGPRPSSGPLATLYPDTKAALLLLLTFLAKQHADSFHAALGSLPANKAEELQAMLGLT